MPLSAARIGVPFEAPKSMPLCPLSYIIDYDDDKVTLNGTLLPDYSLWRAAINDFRDGGDNESFLLEYEINEIELIKTQEIITYLRQLSEQ